ncbi:MAG TPA: hypothetical protein VJ508_14955 [Saprospiraceae bacterium]|jgi:hypothetical protein|nr:hypothetical protein [Saprospiraceae bacterium]
MRLPNPNRESSVLKACKGVLVMFGFPYVRLNVGGARYHNKDGSYRYVRYGVKAMADLWAVVPISGRTMTIETKRPVGGKYSDDQIAFRDMIRGTGGVAGFVSDPAVLHRVCLKLRTDPWSDVSDLFDEEIPAPRPGSRSI